ncbi:MAG: hypothetical protein AB8G17_09540 [Gammaproteobacteria bacterium]
MTFSVSRALVALLAALCLSAGAVGADVPTVQFAGNGDQPIVTLSRTHGMVRGLVEKPLVNIYADGRVEVERPAYMIRPGRYEFQLPAEGLAQLIASFDTSGVLKMDVRDVTAQRDALARAQRNATGEMFMTTDPTLTQIAFDFASFSRDGSNPAPLANQIRFSEVQVQAQRYKSATGLNALADAERQLLALIDHPEMRAIGGQSND